MGSSFSPVSAAWERYIERAESMYRPGMGRPWGKDAVWFTALLAPLLFELCYNGHPLTYSSTHGWHYLDDKGEIRQLRTSRGQKTAQVLNARHAKVLSCIQVLLRQGAGIADIRLEFWVDSGQRPVGLVGSGWTSDSIDLLDEHGVDGTGVFLH